MRGFSRALGDDGGERQRVCCFVRHAQRMSKCKSEKLRTENEQSVALRSSI